jgi:hypothetical protein
MLTKHERAVIETTGMVPTSRLDALVHALRSNATDARNAAAMQADERAEAALRGKAKAYLEAASMVAQISGGYGIRPRGWSSARARAMAFKQRRADRVLAQDRKDNTG